MIIKGKYTKQIYNNPDNLYTVGLIKILECSIDSLINKTITFTGTFSNIFIDDILILNGELVNHYKYGDQFNTKSFEKELPKEENNIISFLSSDLFPGIGESKAKKIYDKLGDNAIQLILKDYKFLDSVKLSEKDKEIIYTKLLEYNDNIEILLKLNNLGFNNKESNLLYKKYKNKVLDIINNNIYDLIDNEAFYYSKIDEIARNLNYDLLDIRRIKATMLYIINSINYSNGDTYIKYDNLYNSLNKVLNNKLDNDLFDQCLIDLININKIIDYDNKYYLKEVYDSEKNIVSRLKYLNNKKEIKIKNLEKELDLLQEKEDIIYNIDQLEAIRSSILNNLLVITGGPGTGKTTIIKAIVNLYKRINKLTKFDLEDIVLLAPTGRAAKRMMDSVNYPAQTIHKFLKWNKETNKFGVNQYNKVDAKLVIIDEFSMVDTMLFDSLLKGLRYDTKLILVGDYNQLPPVGMGQLLKDIIESNMFKVIKLENIYRQSINSNILNLAKDIKYGITEFDYLNKSDDLSFIKCDSYNLIDKLSEICYTYKDYKYNEFQIMAPMYKTLNGIDNLNSICQNIFNPKKDQNEIIIGDTLYRENDKVIELINMPEDNIYNGDIGIIKRIDNINKEIYVDYDSNLVKYTKANFKNIKLGYVISIHKSQGSEFKLVIIPILEEYGRMLYRKLIYTGVTRAKNNLFLLGEESALIRSINTNISLDRNTGIIEFLNND